MYNRTHILSEIFKLPIVVIKKHSHMYRKVIHNIPIAIDNCTLYSRLTTTLQRQDEAIDGHPLDSRFRHLEHTIYRMKHSTTLRQHQFQLGHIDRQGCDDKGPLVAVRR